MQPQTPECAWLLKAAITVNPDFALVCRPQSKMCILITTSRSQLGSVAV